MSLRRWYREFVMLAALIVGAALPALTSEGRIELFDGLQYDLLLAAAPLHSDPKAQNVVVVALDRRSLSAKEFQSVPRVFLSPIYAELIDGLFAGNAKAIGFDVVFSYPASRFVAIEPHYDEPLLSALAQHRDRIVLARTLGTPVAEPFVASIFDLLHDVEGEEPRAIAYSELVPSEDGVQRWIFPEYIAEDGTSLPAFAARLAEVAGGTAHAEPFMLAPSGPLENIPTFAIADVLQCIRTKPTVVAKAFNGQVVLVGSNLIEEDRTRTSDRFLRRSEPRAEPLREGDCDLQVLGPSDPEGTSVPRVHVHAAAVAALLGGPRIVPAPMWAQMALGAAAATITAACALFLPPLAAVLSFVALVAIMLGASLITIGSGYWLPVAAAALSALLALILGQVSKFVVVERRRRRIERAFGHYLAPGIVRELAENKSELHLGGQTRDVTVMFADLSNFTSISDTMSASDLMELTNRYFTAIVSAIDDTGGYVDKFIGDAVMAIWGAPSRTPDAAGLAMRAAFLIQQRVEELRRSGDGVGRAAFEVKIGISSGPAVVGNVGAPGRFNYTALGATVNLAARLEKACATFGCKIVVDETTVRATRDRYLFCELDAVALKGKEESIAVFEAVAPVEGASAEELDYVARYKSALELYRNGEWEAAANVWASLDVCRRGKLGLSAPGVMAKLARSYGFDSGAVPEG